MTERMTSDEHELYDRPTGQEPRGSPLQRGGLTAVVPVRFSRERLEEIRRRAEAEDRSVSSWIRRAVERALHSSDK
jgi:hypothetical protein